MAAWLRIGLAVSTASVCLLAAGAAQGEAPQPGDQNADANRSVIDDYVALVEQGSAEASDLIRLAWFLERDGQTDLARTITQSAYDLDPALAPKDESEPIAAPRGAIGADVILCSMTQGYQWTSTTVGGTGPIQGGTIRVYSFGTTSKNVGDVDLSWQENTKLKPLINQSVYRLIDGRIEQVGSAWLKHGFCALNTTICGPCDGPSDCPDFLAPGCSDPYSSFTNGTQRYLGPHAEVNPVTGDHIVAHDTPGTTVGDGRIWLHVDVLSSVSSNPDVRLFLEGQYVHMEDAAAGNAMNNATYVEALVLGPQQDINPNFIPNNPRIGLPAVYALQEFDPTAMVVAVDVPGDGRFNVASNAVRTQSGTWRYEYAVHNYNSDRAAHSFEVEASSNASPTNPGFKDIDYRHGNGVGGVNYDGADWSPAIGAGAVQWTCADTHAQNPNANALRWSTTYNFWFESASPPTERQATIGLFKPGSPSSISVAVLAPQAMPGDTNGDGVVGSADLANLLGSWGTDAEVSDLDADGVTGPSDLALLLGNWTP